MGNSPATVLENAVMKAISQPKTPPQPPDPSSPAFSNPALARCIQARASVIQAAISQQKVLWQYSGDATAAYRDAMPPLSGTRNIRDFIACTAHAMLIGAIDSADGARLLYAAQVAYSAHQARPRIKSKSGAKTAQKPTSEPQIAHPISSSSHVE
jgi:hypothetical protein